MRRFALLSMCLLVLGGTAIAQLNVGRAAPTSRRLLATALPGSVRLHFGRLTGCSRFKA